MRRLAAAAAAAAVGEGGDDGACFPSTTQRRTCALPLRTRDLGPDPGRNRSRVGCLDLQPARGEAGGNTYLCIFGNLWACLFAGKSGFLPPWVLEARVAKGHRLEEDQEWATWGGAEATVGENSHRLGVRGAWLGEGLGSATSWLARLGQGCPHWTSVSESKQLHPGRTDLSRNPDFATCLLWCS